MSIQHKSLLAASNILDPDHQYEVSVSNISLAGGLGRIAVPLSFTPVRVPTDIGPVAVTDTFGTTEIHIFGDGENLFADNGSGEDSGSEFSITAVNGNANFVGIPITLASGAILLVNADGTFSYDSNGAYHELAGPDSGSSNRSGTDSFTYTISGGSTATVHFTITGVDNDDFVDGSSEDDNLSAGVGDDRLQGYAGNDHLDGGSGNNMAVYGGNLGNYVVDYNPSDRSFSVVDFRDESPDGVDTLTNILHLKFANADEYFTLDSGGNIAGILTTLAGSGSILNEFDTLNLSPWGSIRTIHGSDGSLTSQEVFTDGGDRWLTTFGNSSWTNAHYSLNDELMSITSTFGDGTHALSIYDFDSSHDWSVIAITYDAQWNVTGTEVTPDGGDGGALHRNNPTDVVSTIDQTDWYSTPYDPDLGAARDNTITGGGANEIFYGYAGNDTIDAGGGNDLIVGGRGDDTLTGNRGNDHFVFSVGDGHDVITDFDSGDSIDFRGYDVTNFEDLLAHSMQIDSDVFITFDSNNQVILKNVLIDNLQSSQFTYGAVFA